MEPERKRAVQRRILLLTKKLSAECRVAADYPTLSSTQHSATKTVEKIIIKKRIFIKFFNIMYNVTQKRIFYQASRQHIVSPLFSMPLLPDLVQQEKEGRGLEM